eukprot:gb/GEZN01000119.1/.p1 GENE.gb/GEZN01000119.1/~~gb/GEZN01000119.1/.p1  ORF type:complete len:1434 (+),score=230.32 gb/GEZN01000119.1/:2-4303(+)
MFLLEEKQVDNLSLWASKIKAAAAGGVEQPKKRRKNSISETTAAAGRISGTSIGATGPGTAENSVPPRTPSRNEHIDAIEKTKRRSFTVDTKLNADVHGLGRNSLLPRNSNMSPNSSPRGLKHVRQSVRRSTTNLEMQVKATHEDGFRSPQKNALSPSNAQAAQYPPLITQSDTQEVFAKIVKYVGVHALHVYKSYCMRTWDALEVDNDASLNRQQMDKYSKLMDTISVYAREGNEVDVKTELARWVVTVMARLRDSGVSDHWWTNLEPGFIQIMDSYLCYLVVRPQDVEGGQADAQPSPQEMGLTTALSVALRGALINQSAKYLKKKTNKNNSTRMSDSMLKIVNNKTAEMVPSSQRNILNPVTEEYHRDSLILEEAPITEVTIHKGVYFFGFGLLTLITLANLFIWYLYRDAIIENGKDLLVYLCIETMDHSVSLIEDWASPAMRAITLSQGAELALDPAQPLVLTGYLLLLLQALPGLRSLCLTSVGEGGTTTCVFNLDSGRKLLEYGSKDPLHPPNMSAQLPTLSNVKYHRLNASDLRIWQGSRSSGVLTEYTLPSSVVLADFITCSKLNNLPACGASSGSILNYDNVILHSSWYASSACYNESYLSAAMKANRPSWLPTHCGDSSYLPLSWQLDVDSSKPRDALPAGVVRAQPLMSLSQAIVSSEGSLLAVINADLSCDDLSLALREKVDVFPTQYADFQLTTDISKDQKAKAGVFVTDQFWNVLATSERLGGPNVRYSPTSGASARAATSSAYTNASIEWLRSTEQNKSTPVRSLRYRQLMTLPFLRGRDERQNATDSHLYLDPMNMTSGYYPKELRQVYDGKSNTLKTDGIFLFVGEMELRGGQWFLVAVMLPSDVYLETVKYTRTHAVLVAIAEFILCCIIIFLGLRLTTAQAEQKAKQTRADADRKKARDKKRAEVERLKALRDLEGDMYVQDEAVYDSDEEEDGVEAGKEEQHTCEYYGIKVLLAAVLTLILGIWLNWDLSTGHNTNGIALSIADLSGNRTFQEVVSAFHAPEYSLHVLASLGSYGALHAPYLDQNETWDRLMYQHMLASSPLAQNLVVTSVPLGPYARKIPKAIYKGSSMFMCRDEKFIGAQVRFKEKKIADAHNWDWHPDLSILAMDNFNDNCYTKYPTKKGLAQGVTGVMVRDTLTHLYKQLGCAEIFKCTERVWYKLLLKKLSNKTLHPSPDNNYNSVSLFSPTYSFPDEQGAGMTYVRALINESGQFVGAIGVDLNLDHLSLFMSRATYVEPFPHSDSFLVEKVDGYLLSISNLSLTPPFQDLDNGQITSTNLIEEVYDNPPLILLGNESVKADISETLSFLQAYNATDGGVTTVSNYDGMSTITSSVKPKRQFEAPDTTVVNITVAPAVGVLFILTLPFRDLDKKSSISQPLFFAQLPLGSSYHIFLGVFNGRQLQKASLAGKIPFF